MGGKSSSSSSTANQQSTTNIDRRAVLQDAAYVGDNSTSQVSFINNSTDGAVLQTLAGEQGDAVKALAQMGATVLKDAGGSVVDLQRDSINANTKAWDSTLQYGATMVDKIIDNMSEGYGIATKAIDKFQPTENANADIGKYAVIAVGVVAAVVFLEKSK